MKKLFCLFLCVCCALSSNLVFAVNQDEYEGISYNLFNLEQVTPLQNISVTINESHISLCVTRDDITYNVIATKNSDENDSYIYDGSCYIGEVEYFCRIVNSNENLSGIIRELNPDKAISEVNQFGFLILRHDKHQINNYLEQAKSDPGVSEIINGNQQVNISNSIQSRSATGKFHIFAQSAGSLTFGEIWANRSEVDTRGNRYYTVTHYNIKIGLPGDSCSLSQVSSTDRATLYRTPTFPSLGLQEVNKQYKIDASHSGQLDVTVTGLYDVNGIPLPVPMIFAKNLVF